MYLRPFCLLSSGSSLERRYIVEADEEKVMGEVESRVGRKAKGGAKKMNEDFITAAVYIQY